MLYIYIYILYYIYIYNILGNATFIEVYCTYKNECLDNDSTYGLSYIDFLQN